MAGDYAVLPEAKLCADVTAGVDRASSCSKHQSDANTVPRTSAAMCPDKGAPNRTFAAVEGFEVARSRESAFCSL
jgi:hypothetical protein